MHATNYFSSTYGEARNKFLETCASLGLTVEHHIHPERGSEDEKLATDVTRVGPDDASHLLFTMSATHGVEGFCGSGAQIGALRSGLYNDLPKGAAVVLIHAINPFGFSWLRRVTHENVDLNRNHLDHDADYPENEGYRQLRDAICPQHWNEDAQAAAQAILDAYAREHGPKALQAAVTRGQYDDPEGLFFGGNATTWSARTLASVISEHTADARHIAFIDYHTGLGPYGYGEPISNHSPGEAAHGRLLEWLGADQVTSPNDGSSTSAPLTGKIDSCVARAAPHASLTMASLEFGTSPVDQVIDALRADCWLHNHGMLDSDQGGAIKVEIRRCFYPDADDWKDLIWTRAYHTERKMIAGLSSLA